MNVNSPKVPEQVHTFAFASLSLAVPIGRASSRARRLALIACVLANSMFSPGTIVATEAPTDELTPATVVVQKLTNGEVQPAVDWTLRVVDGADARAGAVLATESSEGSPDGLLFDGLELQADGTYSVCQTNIPAGWASRWRIDRDGDSVIDGIVAPDNPNVADDPPQDLGQRCLAIGEGSAFPLNAGTTIFLEVDNRAPGGDPRGAGFWKNWNSCSPGLQYDIAQRNGGADAGWFVLDDILSDPGISWGDFSISDCDTAVGILDQRDGRTGKKRASDAHIGE